MLLGVFSFVPTGFLGHMQKINSFVCVNNEKEKGKIAIFIKPTKFGRQWRADKKLLPLS